MKLSRKELRKIILKEIRLLKESRDIRMKYIGKIPEEDFQKMDKYFKDYFEPYMLRLGDDWVHPFDDWREHNAYLSELESARERCIKATGDGPNCNYVLGDFEFSGYIDPSTKKNNRERWAKEEDRKKAEKLALEKNPRYFYKD